MAKFTTQREGETSLAVRAAWLHFIGGLTQAQVADRLGVSGVKAHRLIARATQIGAVKVTIVGEIAECARLESELSARYGLDYCEVLPDIDAREAPLRELGNAGAAFLRREIEARPKGVVGIGNGRTLSSVVSAMTNDPAPDVRFVSLLGGLTRNFAANPFDVMHRLAEKTQAEAYTMPVPFFANTAADRDVLLAQHGVQEVLALVEQAEMMLVGVGAVAVSANLIASHVLEPAEIEAVGRMGAVGEMLGHFVDRNGRVVSTELSDRVLSPSLDVLRNRRVVAIAGGQDKVAALGAVLATGYLRGLITVESSARALISAPLASEPVEAPSARVVKSRRKPVGENAL